jgi:cytochrome c peroxidase
MFLVLPAVKAVADEIKFPDGLRSQFERPTTIPEPADNPFSEAKYRLGNALFFEPRLSGSGVTSCASCHNPGLSWGDGMSHGVGFGHKRLPRKSPSILNLAWDELYFWDGRSPSLEDQALKPITSEAEMHLPGDSMVRALDTPGYRAMFQAAFPEDNGRISPERVAMALATFERKILSADAPFDRWVRRDETAVPPAAKRGFLLFVGKANCAVCHAGWRFTDGGFHDIGLPDADVGRGKILPLPAMQHAFKTQGLRDIIRRYPYMHDGSLTSLDAVIRHYDGGFTRRDSLDSEMRPLGLSVAERADLIAFLKSLTSDPVATPLPVLPR